MPVFPEPPPSERDYIAPTVFKKSGVGITGGWNYYGTLNEAIVKWKYLNKIAGGANISPEGQIYFEPNTSAQTLGINTDFYILDGGSWKLSSYKYLRGVLTMPPMCFRFYTTNGAGPYYAIFDSKSLALSATPITSVSPEKLAALDAFYREVALMKYTYNSLAGFLNGLAKRQLSPKEQQIFNEGALRLQNMQQQINQIRGIELTYTSTGAIGKTVGIVPILIIAIVAILAAAAAWTITEIVTQKEKTKQINDAFQLTQWVANKKTEIAQLLQSGSISAADANSINSTLDKATETANAVAANASKQSEGILSQVTSLLKWAIGGYAVYEGINYAKSRR